LAYQNITAGFTILCRSYGILIYPFVTAKSYGRKMLIL